MVKDILGGFPCEIVDDGKTKKIKFFPKNPNAKNPNSITFVLPINSDDKQKLLKILNSIK